MHLLYTHLRPGTNHRGRDKCTNIRIQKDSVLDISKIQFLSNKTNKQRFVDFIVSELNQIPKVECIQAPDDADTLIVSTGIDSLAESVDVTIYGDDTDLITLLIHRSSEIEATTNQLFFQTKVNRWNVNEHILKIQGEPYTKRILALHAFSGCDTTSRIFGKGKINFFLLMQRMMITGMQLINFMIEMFPTVT